MQVSISIRGMHCEGCVRRLTESLSRVPGVTSARVTLRPPEALLDTDGWIDPVALDTAARSAGDYSIAPEAMFARSQAETAQITAETPTDQTKPSLYPLGLIVAFIAATSALTTMVRGDGSWHSLMLDFMAGFFLVFSFFKLLDLRGFADAYQSYDILARRVRAWAFVYPFIELALGTAYLIRWNLVLTNSVTLGLMLLGSVGVLRAVLRKDRIRCACLGTALNLPMTTVTVVEDLGMAAMAAAALIWGH